MLELELRQLDESSNSTLHALNIIRTIESPRASNKPKGMPKIVLDEFRTAADRRYDNDFALLFQQLIVSKSMMWHQLVLETLQLSRLLLRQQSSSAEFESFDIEHGRER